MCASSSLRCGSCLAKWTGKSWEESYKCVLSLKSWSLVLNKKFQLCVEGHCDIDFNLAVCIPITERLNSYWVSNEYTLVKLRGILKNEKLPDYVAQRFSHGIPTDWKEIESKWVEFVRQGEKSSFCWQNDDSFDSCDSAFLFAATRKIATSGTQTNGKSKEKSVQRIQPCTTTVRELDRDSALASTDLSTQKNSQSKSTHTWVSPSPWLPPHKVKEISQWICGAHIPANPLDSDIETESGCRESLIERTSVLDKVESPKNRVQNLETVHPKLNSKIPQSRSPNSLREPKTPIDDNSFMTQSMIHSFTSEVFSKPKALRGRPTKNSAKSDPKIPQTETHVHSSAKNTEVPSTSSNSSLNHPESDSILDVFCEPKNSTRGRSRKNAAKSTAKNVQSQSLPQPLSKNSEVPGSLMGRMLSATLRPRRKQSMKVERWRPVLGIDGCLKVQGYLLLQSDMTAGQILTTNTVIEWGNRRVFTCDRREYELVGDSYGKLPDNLKRQLLAPMDCEDILTQLREFQSLKDRADWGAEYEYFYDVDDADEISYNTSKSRLSQRERNDSRTTPQTTPSARQKSRSGAQAVTSQNTTTPVMVSPTTSRSTNAVEKSVSASSKTSTRLNFENSSTAHNHPTTVISHSSVKNNSQIANQQTPSKTPSSGITHKSRRRLRINSSSPDNRRGSAVANNHLQELNQNIENNNNNNNRCSTEPVRSCFENITWKNTQNQMMLPSPSLSADSSIVDFSSSRIKVSYITPSPKSAQKTIQRSANQQLVTNNSITSEENTPKSRPSRTPVKRACFPCNQLMFLPSVASRSPQHSHVHHTSLPERTVKRVVSPSPLGRRSGRVFSSPPTNAKMPAQTTSVDSVKARATPQTLQLPNQRTANSLGAASLQSSSTKKPPTNISESCDKKSMAQLRVLVQRLDARKHIENQQNRSRSLRRRETSVSPKRKSVAKESKQKPQKVLKKAEKGQKKKELTVTKKKLPSNKKVAAGKKKPTVKKRHLGNKEKTDDDTNSECSNASDISVGPSASVIFSMHDSPTARCAPRTLKERRERDAKLAEMEKQLVAKKSIMLDADDPLANLFATQKNIVLSEEAQEWCKHENFLRQNRKRRRPSSSEGTVSPSRSGCDDGYCNEDATSSVATPQLLMRPHDPNKVQSYLQRQRALNARPQRPTRQVRRNKDLMLPDIDYGAVFRLNQTDSDESSAADSSDPEWV